MDELLNKLATGGTGVGWVLAAYLLWRLQSLTDKQVDANLRVAKALTAIKTLLSIKLGTPLADEED